MSFQIIEQHCPEFLNTHEVIVDLAVYTRLLLLPLELKESEIARKSLNEAKNKYIDLFGYLSAMDAICKILPRKYLYKEKEKLLNDLKDLLKKYNNLLKDMNENIAPYMITYQKIEKFDILIMMRARKLNNKGYFEHAVEEYKKIYTDTSKEIASY